jgi:hypothetical protein
MCSSEHPLGDSALLNPPMDRRPPIGSSLEGVHYSVDLGRRTRWIMLRLLRLHSVPVLRLMIAWGPGRLVLHSTQVGKAGWGAAGRTRPYRGRYARLPGWYACPFFLSLSLCLVTLPRTRQITSYGSSAAHAPTPSRPALPYRPRPVRCEVVATRHGEVPTRHSRQLASARPTMATRRTPWC